MKLPKKPSPPTLDDVEVEISMDVTPLMIMDYTRFLRSASVGDGSNELAESTIYLELGGPVSDESDEYDESDDSIVYVESDESAVSAEFAESAVPAESTESAVSAESTESAVSVESAVSSGSSGSTESAVSSESAESTVFADPSYTARLIPFHKLTRSFQLPVPVIPHPPPPAPRLNGPIRRRHPDRKQFLPAPNITLTRSYAGKNPRELVLAWTMNITPEMAKVSFYQVYTYHEVNESIDVPREDLWTKIGDVNALPLPMGVSLNKFSPGFKYHFTVRAIDVYSCAGPFSTPQSFVFNR